MQPRLSAVKSLGENGRKLRLGNDGKLRADVKIINREQRKIGVFKCTLSYAPS